MNYKITKRWKETNLPCPCGKSSDAYALDVNGRGFCFRGGCQNPNQQYNNLLKQEGKEYIVNEVDNNNKNIHFDFYAHRGISKKTMEYYDVRTKFEDNEPIECGFILPNKSVQIKKLDRNIKPRYRVEGPYGESGLYGKDKFDPGSKESITIFEGFHDALAGYEMTNGQSACVSIKSSSSAKADCVKDWEYINSFKKIILCLDSDEPGRQASRDIAGLFDFNKVYQVKLHKYKDANEYLENQESQDFYTTWKSARRFAPDNIISTFSEIREALKKDTESHIGDYPFKALNQMTYGLHEGEVVVVKAEEKVGKTEFFRAVESHLLETTDFNLGIIHLEEDNGTTVKAIAGYKLNVPAVLPDCGLSDDDIMEGYRKAVKDNEGRVHIYSSFDQEDEQQLLDNIRFLVSAAGCKFIFLDHISWLATGKEDDDERKKLDRLSQKLKLLAKELRFCMIMISHVNDNGQTRGSRNIAKVANTILSLSRDKISSDPVVRNTIEFMLEGVRLGGQTGPAGKALFNRDTGKLEDSYSEV